MSLALPAGLRERWLSGEYVGAAKPDMLVRIRKVTLIRRYDAQGQWGVAITPTTAWKPLPNIYSCTLDQSFDQNGITTCNLDLSNVHMEEVNGAHRIRRGWFSPFRAYRGDPRRPSAVDPADGSPVVANEWDRLLNTAAQIDVWQGYGADMRVRTFTGLIDRAQGGSLPDHLKITARDFGQLLVDAKLFGWNLEPGIRDRLTFVPPSYLAILNKGSAREREQVRRMTKAWVVVKDYADIVRWSLRCAGWPKGQWDIQDTGANLAEPLPFDHVETHMDVIRKVQDLTGHVFFIGEPTATREYGVPTFRRSRAVVRPMTPVVDLKSEQMLTGCEWVTDDDPKATIIRVRGKETPRARGGRPIGHDRPTLLAFYRPPWHRSNSPSGPRDARILKHVIVTEPMYKTQQQVEVAARMIALAMAMAGDTATAEIPAFPGLQLDDIVNLDDPHAGINSRAWLAQKTTTFQTGENASWKQTLGMGLLDTPDVTECISDLQAVL